MIKKFGAALSGVPEISDQIKKKLLELNITTSEELVAIAAVKGGKKGLAKHLGISATALTSYIEKVKKSLPDRIVKEMEEPYNLDLGLGALEPLPEVRIAAGFGPYETTIPLAALPTNVNYIYSLNPIRDQGARGTCIAFACTALNEYYHSGHYTGLIDLSEQCLYARCKEHDGVPNEVGTYVHVAMDCLVKYGQSTESCAPYNPNLPHNQPGHQPCCVGESPQWTLPNWKKLSSRSVADIKGALADHRVVAFSIPVYDSWYYSAAVRASGDITMPLPGDGFTGGHAMLFVGYQDDATVPGGGYFILRNSWGTPWGENCIYGAGYGTIPYQYMTNYGWEAATHPAILLGCPPAPRRMPIECPPAPRVLRCPPGPGPMPPGPEPYYYPREYYYSPWDYYRLGYYPQEYFSPGHFDPWFRIK